MATFAHGIRFDAVSAAYVLLPFVLLLPAFQKLRIPLRLYFLAGIGAMNMLNCIDAEFFRFIARRSTDDLFRFAFLSNDIFNIGFDLIRDFWYLLILWALVMGMVLLLYNRFVHTRMVYDSKYDRLKATGSMVLMAALMVIAMRGGFQRVPIGIIDAGMAEDPRLSVLELNSAFTVLKTFGKPDLKEMVFFDDADNPVSPIVSPAGPLHGHLNGVNVVLLIVESLSSEYMGVLNGTGTGYAPFTDSLSKEGLLLTNAFANGHRSIEGVPACLASLPTLMYEPFITSRYVQNRFTSLANVLGPLGYASYFMHGGENGSMGLEAFTGQAGFKTYIGKNQYPDLGHHDGHWGIFDHHFLRYATQVFSKEKGPFVAGIFTLSSHHPYTVPKEMAGKFPKGTLPIHESMGYADWSLSQFFKAAQATDWYANTLFVITADHTSLSEMPAFQTKLGSLSIPIIFFHPGDTILKGTLDVAAQQIDIMPSVLSLLGYDSPYFCLGQNVFDPDAQHMAVAFKFDQYQMLRDGMLLSFDGERALGIHDVNNDPMLKRNVMELHVDEISRMEPILKGYLQNYSKALVQNRMTLDTWEQKGK